MPSGDAVANVNIATSESWKDKHTGEAKERTEWHRVVFFGKVAEVVDKYVKKGSKIYVEGQLRTRKWQGQDGQDRYTTEIVVAMGGTMQMLDARQDDSPTTQKGQGNGRPAQTPTQNGRGSGRPPEPPPFDDDIPF